MNDSKPLSGRIALITGASRGIGYSAAIALAEAGAHVLGLARTEGGLAALEQRITSSGGKATMIPFDLLEHERIDDLGAEIFSHWGKLDILIGNAGILGPLSPVGHVKPDEWQKVIDLNLTANWRLLRILDPLLQRSDAGRAIFVTASEARQHQPFWAVYATSKAALERLVLIYAEEMKTTSVKANLLDPGVIRTALRTKAFPGENPETLLSPDVLGPTFVEMSCAGYDRNGELLSFRP